MLLGDALRLRVDDALARVDQHDLPEHEIARRADLDQTEEAALQAGGGFGVSVAGAIGLVLLMLLWRWAISLSAIAFPARVPELELETISASHFVEKVRWCMDRLGVEYREKPVGGTLGALLL